MKNIKTTKKIIGILIASLLLFFITLQIWSIRSLKTIKEPNNQNILHISYQPIKDKRKILIIKGRSNINGSFRKHAYLQYGTENNTLNYTFDTNDSAIVITPRNPFVKRPDKLYLELYGVEKIYIYDRSKLTLGINNNTDSLQYKLSVEAYGLSEFYCSQKFDTLIVKAHNYSKVNILNSHYLQIFEYDKAVIYSFYADIITGKIKRDYIQTNYTEYYYTTFDGFTVHVKPDSTNNREYRDLIVEPD